MWFPVVFSLCLFLASGLRCYEPPSGQTTFTPLGGDITKACGLSSAFRPVNHMEVFPITIPYPTRITELAWAVVKPRTTLGISVRLITPSISLYIAAWNGHAHDVPFYAWLCPVKNASRECPAPYNAYADCWNKKWVDKVDYQQWAFGPAGESHLVDFAVSANLVDISVDGESWYNWTSKGCSPVLHDSLWTFTDGDIPAKPHTIEFVDSNSSVSACTTAVALFDEVGHNLGHCSSRSTKSGPAHCQIDPVTVTNGTVYMGVSSDCSLRTFTYPSPIKYSVARSSPSGDVDLSQVLPPLRWGPPFESYSPTPVGYLIADSARGLHASCSSNQIPPCASGCCCSLSSGSGTCMDPKDCTKQQGTCNIPTPASVTPAPPSAPVPHHGFINANCTYDLECGSSCCCEVAATRRKCLTNKTCAALKGTCKQIPTLNCSIHNFNNTLAMNPHSPVGGAVDCRNWNISLPGVIPVQVTQGYQASIPIVLNSSLVVATGVSVAILPNAQCQSGKYQFWVQLFDSKGYPLTHRIRLGRPSNLTSSGDVVVMYGEITSSFAMPSPGTYHLVIGVSGTDGWCPLFGQQSSLSLLAHHRGPLMPSNPLVFKDWKPLTTLPLAWIDTHPPGGEGSDCTGHKFCSTLCCCDVVHRCSTYPVCIDANGTCLTGPTSALLPSMPYANRVRG
eukprot:NODE_139_length_2143_cov_110.898313_g116_i0.p1 GENE.NODE_139_length_2143_cov_110.898313_g116_i0~~NODE_139_length_2143_cov_110.898313_g116_i0.p1  ORF type:complete len:676 (+),score=40.29 NODE_139_length_2143_cov_110.898313_g116_i0:67-2094(+)